MKANELRIGNYVGEGALHTGIGRNKESIYYTVNQITEQCAFFKESSVGEYFKDIQPIPLTEEWLMKLGFLNLGGYLWDCKELGECRFLNNPYSIIHFEIRGYFEKTHIQYIHQLQNLYFALCDEELIIK